MSNQRSMFISVLRILLCLSLLSGCNPLTSSSSSLPPTTSASPVSPTPGPTETPTPVYLASSINPIAQGYHRVAYDSESAKVVLLNLQGNSGAFLSPETWAFDFDTRAWENRNTGLTNGEGPMAYDTQSDRVILFLGSSAQFEGISRTLAYDYNSDTWMDMNPAEAPFGLLGARMVYDSESDKIILFGNFSTETFRETPEAWVYDYESNTWTNMQPAGTIPRGSNFFALSYDTNADLVIAWMCEASSPQCRIRTYDYNSNTWEERKTEISPASREYNAMVYDPKVGLNILFGGQSFTDVLSETWGYDYASNTWKLLPALNPPDPRAWHAMTYLEQAGLIFLFGGGKSKTKFTDETWVYDSIKGEWIPYYLKP